MAQNENQVDVSIKLGADISGGVQTEKELERIRSKAKETERTAKNVDGFKKLRQGAEDVRLCHIIYFERKRLTAHARRKIQNKKIPEGSLRNWCSGRDSNPQGSLHMHLKHACLPISPPEQG